MAGWDEASCWKITPITLIPKKGRITSFMQLRDICRSQVLCKLYKKVLVRAAEQFVNFDCSVFGGRGGFQASEMIVTARTASRDNLLHHPP